jgi:hypothetical protein
VAVPLLRRRPMGQSGGCSSGTSRRNARRDYFLEVWTFLCKCSTKCLRCWYQLVCFWSLEMVLTLKLKLFHVLGISFILIRYSLPVKIEIVFIVIVILGMKLSLLRSIAVLIINCWNNKTWKI